jgi:branched-chain amino acid transport system ATP-binding protein
VTQGLAPLVRRDIWRVIDGIRQAGVVIVIVDKEHAAVNALADRSVVLVKGRAVFAGPARNSASAPASCAVISGCEAGCGGS